MFASAPRRFPAASDTLDVLRRSVLSPEGATVGAGAIAVLVGYIWMARFDVDLMDEGYFVDMAARVIHGQLPYRDFDTYYTPGMFYVDVAIFSIFGVSVVPARWLMILVRASCGLLLYRLARRVAPWPFASIPPLVLAAMDFSAGSHPAWPALSGTLLMLELLANHQQRTWALPPAGRSGSVWLFVAGAAAGLAFAFKQNVGAFAVLGGIGYILVSPSSSDRWLVVARVAYSMVVGIAIYGLLAPGLDEKLAITIWLPAVGALCLLTAWPTGCSASARDRSRAIRQLLRQEVLPFAIGAALSTFAWLVPLVIALGPGSTPFALFAGQVNQGALAFPLEDLSVGTPKLMIISLWAPVLSLLALSRPSSHLMWTSLAAALGSAFAQTIRVRSVALNTLAIPEGRFPFVDWLDLQFGTVYLYLSALIAWSTLLFLIAVQVKNRLHTRWRRSERSISPPPLALPLLLAGALANLALFPRADSSHALLAGAPLLIVGAWLLARVHAWLAEDLDFLGRAVLFASLLTVPTVASAPHAASRFVGLLGGNGRDNDAAYRIPFGADAAPVLVPGDTAANLGGAIHYVQEHTATGEPLFAYPVDPLVNVLADRPNPTRFDHFFPGALTSEDMRGVVASLEHARPPFVFWDHAGVVFWETDKPNRILSDYIWSCYREVAAFGLYLVLERSCP